MVISMVIRFSFKNKLKNPYFCVGPPLGPKWSVSFPFRKRRKFTIFALGPHLVASGSHVVLTRPQLGSYSVPFVPT